MFTGIVHWLSWPYCAALFRMLHPRSFPFSDIWGTDIAGGAILALVQWSQATPSMPSNGNALWYQDEATDWVREYLPIGNGYLGGGPLHDILTLSSY